MTCSLKMSRETKYIIGEWECYFKNYLTPLWLLVGCELKIVYQRRFQSACNIKHRWQTSVDHAKTMNHEKQEHSALQQALLSYAPGSHCLYRILDGKKTSRFQFSVPGLGEIHRNLKQFNSRESFFRKSPFCTFSCINPGFGGPWVIFFGQKYTFEALWKWQ